MQYKIKMTEKQYENCVEWVRRFERAYRCKRLCFERLKYICDHDVLDRRMTAMWKAVEEVEPIKTFEKGCLTNNAAGFKAHIMLSMIDDTCKQSIIEIISDEFETEL